jgi:hypothetical protein
MAAGAGSPGINCAAMPGTKPKPDFGRKGQTLCFALSHCRIV